MKTALVYYSYTGHLKHFAEEIKQHMDIDVYPIEPLHNTTGKNFFKYLLRAIKSGLKLSDPIMPINLDSTKYDHMIIATPVWTGYLPPCMNSFLKSYSIECDFDVLLSCFVEFDFILNKFKNGKYNGTGKMQNYYVIYDNKPERIIDVINQIKKNSVSVGKKFSDNEIYLDSLY